MTHGFVRAHVDVDVDAVERGQRHGQFVVRAGEDQPRHAVGDDARELLLPGAGVEGNDRDASQEHAARPDVSSFTVQHESQPFAYIEVYELLTSVLAEHGDWTNGDLGFHFAVVEPLLLRRGLARGLMGDLCQTLFEQYPTAERIGVEPDVGNKPIARLFEYTGFTRVRSVQLPHKVAALIVLPRHTPTHTRS